MVNVSVLRRHAPFSVVDYVAASDVKKVAEPVPKRREPSSDRSHCAL